MSRNEMLVFSKRRRAAELEEVQVKLRGEAILRSKKVEYLGVWIDDELKWNEHIMAGRRMCLMELDNLRRPRDFCLLTSKRRSYTMLLCCRTWTTVVSCGKSAEWNCSRS